MTDAIAIPAWAAALLALLAAWAVLALILLPLGRRLMRGRARRAADRLDSRLQFGISRFHRTRRRVLVDRLANDPAVLEAVADRAAESGQSQADLLREVEVYAREIVPSFNAYAYFRLADRMARRIAQMLYRVRLGNVADEALAQIEPDASIVLVMNHRSNMDYLVVTYMVASRAALSYAVGEWARVWPLTLLVRALGAYFVRRHSGSRLYRRVLARYVQMAAEGGVVQALYPEGGLSRDGRLRAPKLGLISYLASGFDPGDGRDLVFIPVGLNYDRVLEDRSLVADLEADRVQVGKVRAALNFLQFVGRNIDLVMRGGWFRFGYACVNFGQPVSMRAHTRERGIDFRSRDEDAQRLAVRRLGDELMAAVAAAVPVLPVPLVATVFARHWGEPLSALEVKAEVHELIGLVQAAGAYVHIPRADRDYAITVGLRSLLLRRLVSGQDGLYRADPAAERILRYYANSIEHFLPDGAGEEASGPTS